MFIVWKDTYIFVFLLRLFFNPFFILKEKLLKFFKQEYENGNIFVSF